MIRRSITIEDELYNSINVLRARLLEYEKNDVDFTSMINALAAIGYNKVMLKELTKKDIQLFRYYTEGIEDLKLESAQDEYSNLWLKYQLPKLMAVSTNKQDDSNSVSGNKKKGTSEPE
ncbi:MAG TPA: hypothetical protein VNK44_04670 [Candidatus Nitrosotenuis sp.]|nr:hypothetical protein [Candidatus Nitrosotenuis sp.]